MDTSTSEALPAQVNVLGEGAVFEGTLHVQNKVHVSGHIKGKLDVKGRAVVSQEGVVEGELRATDADVAGSVQGTVRVDERLMLKSTARIDGDITAGRIKVEEGALFAGQCTIGDQVSEKVQAQVEKEIASGHSEVVSAPSSASASSEAAPAKGAPAKGGAEENTRPGKAARASSTDGPAKTAKKDAARPDSSASFVEKTPN